MAYFLTIPEKMARYREDGECWIWDGPVDAKGYGLTYDGRRGLRAHRLSYMYHIGDIPEGKQIHHTCEQRACINPAHLVAITSIEHNRIHRKKRYGLEKPDRCYRGHHKKVYPDGRRRCLVCEWETKARSRGLGSPSASSDQCRPTSVA